jgi:hypothetical protein
MLIPALSGSAVHVRVTLYPHGQAASALGRPEDYAMTRDRGSVDVVMAQSRIAALATRARRVDEPLRAEER